MQQSARERATGSPRQRESQHVGQGFILGEIEIAYLLRQYTDGVTREGEQLPDAYFGFDAHGQAADFDCANGRAGVR